MNWLQTSLLGVTSYGWTVFCLYWIYASVKTKDAVKKESGASRFIYIVLLLIAFGLVYWKRLSFGLLSKNVMPDSNTLAYTGLIISLAGIAFAIVARVWLGENWSGTVTIKKDHELIQRGPYKFIRHPIYTGVFFGLFGAVMIQNQIQGTVAIVLLFIALNIKIAREEKFLSEIFPQYEAYKSCTKKLIPFVY